MVWGLDSSPGFYIREGGNKYHGKFLLYELVTPQRRDVSKISKLVSLESQSLDVLDAEKVSGTSEEAHGGKRFPIGNLDRTQRGQLLFKSSVGGSLPPFSTAWILNQEALWLIAGFCLPSLALPSGTVPPAIFSPTGNYTLCEGKANWEVLPLAPEGLEPVTWPCPVFPGMCSWPPLYP